MINYEIQITPIDATQEPYIFKVQTHDLEWTMEQYQRNREIFEWELIKAYE